MEEQKQEDKILADRYRKHLEAVKKYQQANAEKCRTKIKEWRQRIKVEKPELYQEQCERKRKYYQDVVKPRKALQNATPSSDEETAVDV